MIILDPVGPEVRLETPSPLRERRGRNDQRQSRSRSRSPLERRQLFPEIQRQEEEEIVPERSLSQLTEFYRTNEMDNINIQGYHHRTSVFINDTTRFIQENEQSDIKHYSPARRLTRPFVPA
ncbi:hypothetical protein JTE90_025036 [Oedothorax gibbosus]|uniref:Uncharacterized protein n=1 Tax=Oedothorax gibbosus TaxID=931172 RepID=A0AAV6TLL4_9ARAC|nr:hypothetical protein JTE90_025036 [Oedothorax gibbosus]